MCTHAFVCLILLEHKCTVNYTVRAIFRIPISFDRRTRDIVTKQRVRSPRGCTMRCRRNEVRKSAWKPVGKGYLAESNFARRSYTHGASPYLREAVPHVVPPSPPPFLSLERLAVSGLRFHFWKYFCSCKKHHWSYINDSKSAATRGSSYVKPPSCRLCVRVHDLILCRKKCMW